MRRFSGAMPVVDLVAALMTTVSPLGTSLIMPLNQPPACCLGADIATTLSDAARLRSRRHESDYYGGVTNSTWWWYTMAVKISVLAMSIYRTQTVLC